MAYHNRLLSLSKRFLTASKDLSQQGGEGWRFPVPHYLAGHAFELALKSHLAHGGASEGDLIDLGHDLEEVLAKADASVQALVTPHQAIAIRWLNPYYRGKELEYPARTIGVRSYPKASYILRAAENVVGYLDVIYRAERKATRSGGTP